MSTLLVLLLLIVLLIIFAWFFVPNTVCLALIKLSRVMSGYQTKTINVDGYVWHYLDSGGDDKEVVLLVHGFGANKDIWLAFGRFFNRRYRVIIPDVPGFGDNAKDPSQSYKIEDQADRLSSFIQLLNLGKVHLTGNSMGGFIATCFALNYPQQLASVVLMNSAGVQTDKKSWLEQHIDQGNNPLVISNIDEMDELFSHLVYKPIFVPKIMKRYVFLDMQANHDFYNSIFWSFFSSNSEASYLNDQLEKITTPLMVIWGVHDQLLDVSCAHLIKENIPSSVLVILDDVGHIPLLEAPKLAADYQLKFLQEL
jgi:abhydrolase domain-containing protein 6